MSKRLLFLFLIIGSTAVAQENFFQYEDVFDLQYVRDPQIHPDGNQIVYRRMQMDIMKDRAAGNLWIMNTSGAGHQKLTAYEGSEYGATWSPNGDRLAYIRPTSEGAEIYVYWTSTKRTAKISQLQGSPSNLSWSPDGRRLVFTMKVAAKPPVLVQMPAAPIGAKWAKKPRITDRLYHEADGRGYIPPGHTHIFMIAAEGSGAIQLTTGDFNHRGPISWSPDGTSIYFSANRSADWEYDFRNSEVCTLTISGKKITVLTDRQGPDSAPQIAPNGKYIAYIGYTDRVQAYQNRQLSIMLPDGSEKQLLSSAIDASIQRYYWAADSKGLYVQYDHEGDTKIAFLDLKGKVRPLAQQVGGTSIGRPYGGGSFSVSKNGRIAYTKTLPEHPAELAVITAKGKRQLTHLNAMNLGKKQLGKVETVWYTSSYDQRRIQGWLVYPPNYDPAKKYPLLVENHGGPISNYGNRFSAELQLYAAAGYIVFYPNPRGSTSYGEEFANLLHHNYPGQDYNDVMDGVDYCIAKGIAHEGQLYVTGGSAGGIMTAWMIGKNNRFRAAVVVKPVMNWISKTLVADNYFQYANTRFPGQPWENFEAYWNFSPLSLVENVNTPTMVMVGMEDLRTPPSEAKQLYHALKLRKVPTVLVEIPEASHGIANRPSNLITKVAHVLSWLNKYRD